MQSESYPHPQYQFLVEDRQYSKYSFRNIQTGEHAILLLNPLQNLFHEDIFVYYEYHETHPKIEIQSSIRTHPKIPAVLILEDNKTYGRTANQKRLLYKCIPDDPRLPIFLVPYDPKPTFSKKAKNKYILLKYDHWSSKHPQGIITETLGNVDQLDAFYEYQIYSRRLNPSIASLVQTTRLSLQTKSHEEWIESILANPAFHIVDLRDQHVFTIDPPNSVDFDDGFSISTPTSENHVFVTVYIAHVFLWIETLQLWDALTERVSTMYLPDRKRPMLPPILSDTLCSLHQDEPRFALAMKFMIDTHSGDMKEIVSFQNVLIQVNRNYRYEESDLFQNPHYNTLLKISRKMQPIENSHDLVAFWMIKMNTWIANYMVREKIGIGRTVVSSQNQDISSSPLSLHSECKRTFQQWKYNEKGAYVMNSEFPENKEPYLHITSPIRRLVDVINQTLLLMNLRMIDHMSPSARSFVEKWKSQIPLLNDSTRAIRKVQTDCDLMYRCMSRPEMLDNIHTGMIFEKNDLNRYTVYCESIPLLTQVMIDQEISLFSVAQFKLFLFENEDKTKKKIRLQFVGF